MLKVLQGDITKLHTDAISMPQTGACSAEGGVDGAIHRATAPELLAEFDKYIADVYSNIIQPS